MQRDREKQFTYGYLPGTHLLQTLVKPNNMTLTQSYEEKRDLLIGQLYKRSNTSVASRSYSYDTLGRTVTRSTSKDGSTVNDTFGYNSRSELNTAMVNNEAYVYDYDNIGNRETAQEAAEAATSYESNRLNQYIAIGDFEPTYDDAGNQTKVKTSTGIWSVVYNAENRPTEFANVDSGTIVECSYDYMGRRATKKVTVNGSVTLHQRFLYRGYLQIACCDLTRSNHPCLWLITWDPSQPVATRPLAIQKDGTWYTYSWDLTKNICEVYGQHGYIRTNYSYTPYGEVTISGDVTQPIQWSSEYSDSEMNLVYYNYRYYCSAMGKWLSRDEAKDQDSPNLSLFIHNSPSKNWDVIGLFTFCKPKCGGVEYDAKVYCCRENKLILKSSLPKCRNCKLENEQCINLVSTEYNKSNLALEKTLNMALTENSKKANDMLEDCKKSFGFGGILYSLCVNGVTAAANAQNGVIWATYQVMASLLRSTRNEGYNKCDFAMKDCSQDVIFARNNCECS